MKIAIFKQKKNILTNTRYFVRFGGGAPTFVGSDGCQTGFVRLVNGALEEILRSAGTTAAHDLVAHSLLLLVDPKEDVLIITSALLEGRKSSSESKELSPVTAASMAATASASSASNLSSLMDEEPISLDSSMIVSILAICDFFVSMTELPTCIDMHCWELRLIMYDFKTGNNQIVMCQSHMYKAVE